jgi:hypothetical protein
MIYSAMRLLETHNEASEICLLVEVRVLANSIRIDQMQWTVNRRDVRVARRRWLEATENDFRELRLNRWRQDPNGIYEWASLTPDIN